MADRPLPNFVVQFLIWGSSLMGAALVGLLIWIFTGLSSQVSAGDERIQRHEERLQVLEAKVPLELQQVRADAARTLRVVEELARKQGVIVP